jgi:hypothetical protein
VHMRTAPQLCGTHSRPSLPASGRETGPVAGWRQHSVSPAHTVTARPLPPMRNDKSRWGCSPAQGDMRSHTRTETVCILSVPDSRHSKGCLLRCARTSPSLNADDVRTPPVASLRETRVACKAWWRGRTRDAPPVACHRHIPCTTRSPPPIGLCVARSSSIGFAILSERSTEIRHFLTGCYLRPKGPALSSPAHLTVASARTWRWHCSLHGSYLAKLRPPGRVSRSTQKCRV